MPAASRLALRALGWKACLANFIEQGAIADFQNFGGLAAVPVIGLQDFQDYVVLHAARHLLRDTLERNVAVFIHFVGNVMRLFLCHRSRRMKRFFGAENDVARHAIFELADIAGPVALLQELQQLLEKPARRRARSGD